MVAIHGCGGSRRARRGAGAAVLLALWLAIGPPAEGRQAEAATAPAGLAQRHLDWLQEVDLLLTPGERQAFLSLRRDYRRDAFVERFWSERDPFPETGQNEFLDLWRERRRLAAERYAAAGDERAEMVLLAGPPDRIERGVCAQLLRDHELWFWFGTAGGMRPFALLFVRDGPGGAFRRWAPSEGLASLLERHDPFSAGRPELRDRLARECPRGRGLLADLDRVDDWRRIAPHAARVPRPSPEWVASFLDRTTELPEAASRFDAVLDVAFSGRHQSRTVVELQVTVAPDTVAPVRGFASLVLDGEILHRGELFEQFRYRFETPLHRLDPERLPLVVERYLRPGRYRLSLRVLDEGSGRYFRAERPLEVPRWRPAAAAPLPVAESTGAPAADPAAADGAPAAGREALGAGGDTMHGAAAAAGDPPVRLELMPPPPRLLTGRVRVGALASGRELAKVAFLLNGRKVMTKRRPPFSVELDLGHAPRRHRLQAIGYDAAGRPLARDEIPLNVGPHRFAVRLVEPQTGSQHRGSVRARVEVDLPRGERLDRLELWVDQTLLATLYQEPFVQRVPLDPDGGVVFVRAVAYLPDGHSTEDLVVVNSPEIQDRVDVDFVELYASVVDRQGRAPEGLTAADVRVFENGEPQRILRFERARDLPIHAGVLIDTSTSMVEELDEAHRAALRFFEGVLEPRDRAAVFVFSDLPELKVPLTGDLEVLAGGLAGLEADGETALYDCLVEALFYFAGIRGRRALVVLTDGEDSNSEHSFDETLEFARRSGTAIYTIALATRDFEIRSLLRRLAHQTGGESFLIERVSQLDRIYDRIEEELRSQYLIGYQSTRLVGDGFREVRVEVETDGLEAKTAPGYYP